MPKLLTVDEAAEQLRLDRVTVWRHCRDGVLPAVQIGRVWRIDADKLREMLDGKAPAAVCADS